MESPQMYWHIHHNVLAEFAIEPIEERIAYIKDTKPWGEIETRLRLMRPVQHKLSDPAFKEMSVAALALRDGEAAVIKVLARRFTILEWIGVFSKSDALNRAEKFRDIVYERYWNCFTDSLSEELEALHKLECPNCPWSRHTIFPDEQGL